MNKRMTFQIILGGLALIIGSMLLSMEPLTGEARASYGRLTELTRETPEYYEVIPEGPLRGGLVIYPDGGEDPRKYAPLAEQLAEEGLATRLVKYPLGRAALSKAEHRALDSPLEIPWIALGFGKGREKSCILADRSDSISGLILIGDCQIGVNLTDNDIRVSFFELADDPVAPDALAGIMKRLPADTVFREAPSMQEILGRIPGEAALSAMRNRQGDDESSLMVEINRILARSMTKRKDR